MAKDFKITTAVHPDYLALAQEWQKYRYIYDGGDSFIEEYLVQFTGRENETDFGNRKAVTPVPGFAAAALIDIKNAIFQRMADVIRTDGPDTYQKAIAGENGGVDLKSSTMHHFIGEEVLPELLFLGKVGIYVDMPQLILGQTKLETDEVHPYFYTYTAEQIKNWVYTYPEDGVELETLLLEETALDYDITYGLPTTWKRRYRLFTRENGVVTVRFFDQDNSQIDLDGNPTTEAIKLDIDRIPFVVFELSHSLLKDIANHQIALLNLESSDINYALLANFPFYTEQYSGLHSAHLKGNEESDDTKSVDVGVVQGRRYEKDMDRPGFIHPSSEPLKASMEKQKNLKDDIRSLVNLSLSAIRPKFASAEAKQMDERGLESGLSFLGLVLEQGERQLSKIFSMYERTKQIATIKYPERYDLKTDQQRITEVKTLGELISTVPSKTAQKAISKRMARILLESRIPAEDFRQVLTEIEAAEYVTSDPEIIHSDIDKGLVSTELASKARGYPEGEVEKAKEDHAERLSRIESAQSNNAGARGIGDKQVDPDDTVNEKTNSQNSDLNDTGKKPVRGKGQ